MRVNRRLRNWSRRGLPWFWRSERWGRLTLLCLLVAAGMAFFRWVHESTIRDDRRILYVLVASWTASIAVSLWARRRWTLLGMGLVGSVFVVDLLYTTFLLGTYQRQAPEWVNQLLRGAAVVSAPLLFIGTLEWAWIRWRSLQPEGHEDV